LFGRVNAEISGELALGGLPNAPKTTLPAEKKENILRTLSRSMLCKIWFSMLHRAKPFHVYYNIADLQQFFSVSKFEKLL
jgi:hypothetical protein